MAINLTTLRRTAAEILAISAIEQFPTTALLGGSGSNLGFHYDFIFPFAFQKEFLPLLEEKMRSISKENRLIEVREMVPKNAAVFFEHLSQPYLAEKAKNSEEGLVSIFQMGNFYDLVNPPFSKTSEQIVAFKLLEAESLPKGITRIHGIAFENKALLKQFQKKLNAYSETNHLFLGKEMDLFNEYKKGLWQWHSKGEFIRRSFFEWWRQEHSKQQFQFPVTPEVFSKEELLQAHLPFSPRAAEIIYLKKFCSFQELEGMLNSLGTTQDIAHIFCGAGNLLQESISSLQFITKISKILSFEWQWVLCSGIGRKSIPWQKGCAALEQALSYCGYEYERDDEVLVNCGPRLELRIQDGLGRFWPTAFLEVEHKKMCLIRSMFGSIERMVALLLERGRGNLPLWLAYEQARVFVIGRSNEDYAKKCVSNLINLGCRVSLDSCLEEKLASRVHKGLAARVPYSIFVGERERKTDLITVRAYGSVHDEQMSLDKLAQKLNRMID